MESEESVGAAAAEVVRLLSEMGADEFCLDDLVIEVCSRLGSEANNGGWPSQAEFLLRHAFDGPRALIDRVLPAT